MSNQLNNTNFRGKSVAIDPENFDQDKYMFCGHSGKQRTKKEAQEHTNHFDPSGQTRKLVTKMQNTEKNQKNRERRSSSSSNS